MNMMMNQMSRIAASFLALLFITASAQAQDPTPKFEEYMNALMKQERFSGSVLVSRNGKAIFSKGYGMANLELDVPNAPNTKFRLGSITKQFTAAAVLLLQERGKLSVQDPVCKYVDACPPAWSEVTVHHLLTHTGGVPSFTNFPDYMTKMMMPEKIDSMIARFKDKPLDFKPNEKWNYSNSGYFLLGHIIEKASGESYEAFLQKNIFDPLGMSNSGYDYHATILKNRATGYSLRNGKVVNSAVIDMSQPYSAGSLYSTVEDLLKWNEALFSDKVLSPKSREAMFTAVKNNYGYGIGIQQKFNRRMISHGGGINGFSTSLAGFPDEKVTVVVLRNRDYGGPGPGAIGSDLAAIVFGEKYEIPSVPVEAKVDPKVFDAYVGRYELAPALVITISREGDRLMAQASGQQRFALYPQSETSFFAKEIELRMTFVKDDKGQVTHVVVNQGGERQAKRIN